MRSVSPLIAINIIDVLQKRPSSSDIKIQAIDHLRERTHSFEYTRTVLCQLEREIRSDIAALEGNDALLGLLDIVSVNKPSK